MRNKKNKFEWNKVIFNVVYALLNLVLTVLFYDKILFLTMLLIILAIVGHFIWKSKITLIIWGVWAIGGPLTEVICIYFGVWSYSYSSFLGIPLWLILLWGNTAAYIYEFSKLISRFGVK